jgi:tetratricopeptide (TPR) repeat protein
MLVSISIILLFGATHSISAQDFTLISSEPENMSELASLLVSLLQEERYEESLPYLDKILEINPNHTSALLNKGSALISLDRSNESIAYFDRLLAIEPNNIKALTSKAAAFSNMGEYVKALELYNKALSIDKNNEKLEKGKARLLSITPTVSSNDFENNDVKYDIHLRVTVRNASGELVAVIEDSHGRYLPGSFTDYVFDQLFEKEIVEINDQKFEVGKKTEVYQSDNDYIGNFWYEAQMSGYNISVFEVYPPHVGVEPSDQLQVEWTVSKKLD